MGDLSMAACGMVPSRKPLGFTGAGFQNAAGFHSGGAGRDATARALMARFGGKTINCGGESAAR